MQTARHMIAREDRHRVLQMYNKALVCCLLLYHAVVQWVYIYHGEGGGRSCGYVLFRNGEFLSVWELVLYVNP